MFTVFVVDMSHYGYLLRKFIQGENSILMANLFGIEFLVSSIDTSCTAITLREDNQSSNCTQQWEEPDIEPQVHLKTGTGERN